MDMDLGEDWARGKEECNVLRRWVGGIEEREWGRRGVKEGASVSLERKERYAWLCDSSYIEHSMCVDTVSCISLRNKLFLPAQCRASSSSSYLNSSLPLSNQGAHYSSHLSPLFSLPIFDLNTVYSLSQHDIYVTITCFSQYYFLGLIVHFSPLPLSLMFLWIQWCF